MLYIPLTEETVALLEQIKAKQEDWDTFLRRSFQDRLCGQDWLSLQQEKMQELWGNEHDEIWNNI